MIMVRLAVIFGAAFAAFIGLIAVLAQVASNGTRNSCTLAQQNVAGLPWKQVGGHIKRSVTYVKVRGHGFSKSKTTGRITEHVRYKREVVKARAGGHWIMHHACHITHHANAGLNLAVWFAIVAAVIVVIVLVRRAIRKRRSNSARRPTLDYGDE